MSVLAFYLFETGDSLTSTSYLSLTVLDYTQLCHAFGLWLGPGDPESSLHGCIFTE